MRKNLLTAAAAAWLIMGASSLDAATVVDGDGRTWETFDDITPIGGQYSPPQSNEYFTTGQDPMVTGRFGIDSAMATPVSIAVGDTISYDYTLTNEQRNFRGTGASNWIGDSYGDFRGGSMTVGYLISGRAGYQFDSAADRTLWFQEASFSGGINESGVGGGTEDSPGIHFAWIFPTSNTYQVTVTNIGSNVPLANFAGSTGGNAVTDITFFRQGLYDSEQTATVTNFAQSSPGSLVFGFEGGITAQGFKNLTAPGSNTNWVSTSATIPIGDGFNLLAATEGGDRVVVDSYADRDNFGHANHRSLVLRSPTFELDSSGGLQVDMMGGMRHGENDPANTEADPPHVGELGSKARNVQFDFGGAGEVDDGKHIQGFALRNALTGQYVLVGSSTATNDGKMRASDPTDRGVWNHVGFTAEQLAPFANDGNRYEIDFFDSFGESSWAWIGFDNLRVPGMLSPFQKGDTNGDNDVDSGDSSVVFGNFTGTRSASPVAKSDGLARIDGDFDGNGDVDGGDVVEHVANIGLTGPTAGSAKLVYDPNDGSVSLDTNGADGNKITTFRLLSDAAALVAGADFPASASSLTTELVSGDYSKNGVVDGADYVVWRKNNGSQAEYQQWRSNFGSTAATEIFWADTSLGGFSGMHDLGAIFASGLTITEVQQALSSAVYVGTAGSGVFDFNIMMASGSGAATGQLTAAVPEPTSLLLSGLLLALVAAGRVRI